MIRPAAVRQEVRVMQETLNIGADRPADDLDADELKQVRGRAVERRGDRHQN